MRRLCTPRWLAWHLTVLAVVAGFLALGWWQVRRAAEGNMLSYGYAVEWPVFAAFVLVIWLREVGRAVRADGAPGGAASHPGDGAQVGVAPVDGVAAGGPGAVGVDALAGSGTAGSSAANPQRITARPPSRPRPAPLEDDPDPALDAYNRYLAWLNANPGRRPAQYRAE